MRPPLPGATTERRLLASSLAAYGSQLGRTLIRIVAEIALARLVIPEAHGLYERALGIMIIAGAVRDLGLLYQTVRDERQPYGTVLLWVASAGALLSALLVLGAPVFAFWDPALPVVVRGLALYVFFDGLGAVPKVFFERRLEVGRLVGPEVLRGLLFAAVAITLAWRGFGVWSFVAAELGGTLLFALLVWRRARGIMPLDVHPRLLPSLLAKSSFLALVWFGTAAVPLVGRYVLDDSSTVAQYNKAHLWALRLHALVLPALARVFYPALVEYRGDAKRFVGAYRLGTVAIASLEALAAYFLFFNAEVVLLDIFLGPNWQPAVPLLRILAFVPLVEALGRLGGELLKVRHEDRAWLVVVLLNLASLVGFGILFTRQAGAAGMAWANYLLLGNLVMAWRVFVACGTRIWRLLGDLLFVWAVPLPLLGGVALLLPPGWGRFAASIVAAGAAFSIVVWRFTPSFSRFFAGDAATAGEDG